MVLIFCEGMENWWPTIPGKLLWYAFWPPWPADLAYSGICVNPSEEDIPKVSLGLNNSRKWILRQLCAWLRPIFCCVLGWVLCHSVLLQSVNKSNRIEENCRDQILSRFKSGWLLFLVYAQEPRSTVAPHHSKTFTPNAPTGVSTFHFTISTF